MLTYSDNTQIESSLKHLLLDIKLPAVNVFNDKIVKPCATVSN